jgi:DNA polymerase III subunit alpha
MTNEKETQEYFIFRCRKGLQKRGLSGRKEYEERLTYEIGVIKEANYVSYFLVVADIVNWALSMGIPVGPGRGSGAGSLVSYVLGITHLDPIKYGLIFERFLNPSRISPPDIDMDFCEERRGEVIAHIQEKYGSDHVAHIGTYGSMKAKGAIRSVTAALGLPYELGDKLAKLILEPIEGKAQPLKICYEKVPELHKVRYGPDSDSRRILIWAERMEDRIRTFGTHASGIVISPQPISQVLPLYLGKDGASTTQFPMETVEEVGLIKFDILGLRALTTIRRCLTMVKKRHGRDIDILNIPVDDPDVYCMLQKGDVEGVFQLEGSSGMRDLLVRLRPINLEDLAVLVAVYRPGPLGSDMLDHYLKVRSGDASPHYLVPELEPVLKSTDGMLIFQEQVMEICKQLAGYTMAEADNMRKIVGKKLPEKMKKEKDKLISGLRANYIEPNDAEQIWNDIETFAGYGFNRAHAFCYAFIGYQMAWLKHYYPLEFMCACLISDSDETDKVIQYINYCQNVGISILGPSVNESDIGFSIAPTKNAIRFGLSAVKNLGKPVSEIIQEKEANGIYTDILDFARRVDISKFNRRKMESLVQAGAFDTCGGYTRASLMAAIDEILRYKEDQKRYESKMETYNKRILLFEKRREEIAVYEASPEGRKRPGMLKLPEEPEKTAPPCIPDLIEFPEEQLLLQEKELTGYYISGHPLDQVKEKSKHPISWVKQDGGDKQKISLVAIPSVIREITTKQSKQKMAYLELEDKTGTIQAVVLPKPYSLAKNLIDITVPARYEVEIEVTEGDVGKLTKIVVMGVEELPSVIAKKLAPLKVVVPLENLCRACRIVKNNPPGDLSVTLFAEGPEGVQWNMGTFSCTGDRYELAKKIRDG